MQHEANEKNAQIIAQNWLRVVDQVEDARVAALRSDPVTIVGVTKYVEAPLAHLLVLAGCHCLGESRPQSLWAKHEWMSEHELAQPDWHMIGHLQRNKVRRTLPMIGCLHSVDSLRLAQTLSSEAERIHTQLPVLVEVNVTQDADKTGLNPEELTAFFEAALPLSGIQITGLMAMASQFSGGAQARREFARVRQLRDEMQQRYPDTPLSQLSMGMSGDFREAIAEGATLVRIGSSLWEGICD